MLEGWLDQLKKYNRDEKSIETTTALHMVDKEEALEWPTKQDVSSTEKNV